MYDCTVHDRAPARPGVRRMSLQVFNNALVLGRIGSGPLVGRIGLRYGLVPVFTF